MSSGDGFGAKEALGVAGVLLLALLGFIGSAVHDSLGELALEQRRQGERLASIEVKLEIALQRSTQAISATGSIARTVASVLVPPISRETLPTVPIAIPAEIRTVPATSIGVGG